MFSKNLYDILRGYLLDDSYRVILFASHLAARIAINTLHIGGAFQYLMDPNLEIDCQCITNGNLLINLVNPIQDEQK